MPATHIEDLSTIEDFADPDGAFRTMTFAALVGLVAKHSGGEAFLGDTAAPAVDAYQKSLIGHAFPSFWMEVPLLGAPGFDLHVYYDRGQVLPGERFAPGCGFGMQALFDWYFGAETGGVGVGFAHDLRDGNGSVGTYVNFNRNPLADRRGFFAALGAEGSHDRAAGLLAQLPGSWRPWYLGLFPDRPNAGVRVGAFVSEERQAVYAADTGALADDLAQAGFTALDGRMLERLSAMAALPFTLELQLDATEEGTGSTLGADLTLRRASLASIRPSSAEDSPTDRACRLLEAWGMMDSRWHHIADASLSSIVPMNSGEEKVLFLLMGCTPSFIKAKWAATQPQPAKVYFSCAVRPLSAHAH